MIKLLRKLFLIFKFALFFTIFITIHHTYRHNPFMIIPLFSLCGFLIINEYIRVFKLNDNMHLNCLLMLITLSLTSILHYMAGHVNTITLMYFLMSDIFKFEKRIIKYFIAFHFTLYFSIMVFSMRDLPAQYGIVLLTINILAYYGIFGMLYSFKNLKIEKEEIAALNEKLKTANIKLQEYASSVEEVTILKERTRVSQELHDSLGHSLMALSMYLEYSRKVCASKPEKLEEVLSKCEEIAKSSISDLRQTVSLLNSELQVNDFDDSVQKLIDNFYLFNNIKFSYVKNECIEDLSSEIKTSLYKTIQEAVTNSLKHGNATEININLNRHANDLNLIITNNGTKCINMVKSNGLTGIEKRISTLYGTVNYISNDDFGFGMNISIPL